MKIIYYTWQTASPGGIERVTISKANYWAQAGHNVWIITRQQQGRAPFWPLDPRVKQIDIDIDYQDVFAISNPISRWRAMRQRESAHLLKLNTLATQIDADIFVCTVFCHEAELIPKLTDRSKKVLESHGKKYSLLPQFNRGKSIIGLIQKGHDWYRRRAYELLPLKFDRFVVLTGQDRRLWQELEKVDVIPNAISMTQSMPLASLDTKCVLAIGRLTYQKHFSELIQIWARVAQSFPDWRLEIYGEGEEQQELEQDIKQRKITNVHIYPPTTHVQEKYLSSSIFVLTSRYEGLPMVLLEAQACGLPIVSYACPCGPSDIITDGEDGYLVSPGDKKLFAERLVQLMSDEDLRRCMGAQAYRGSQRFTQENVMKQWLDLFTKLTYAREN